MTAKQHLPACIPPDESGAGGKCVCKTVAAVRERLQHDSCNDPENFEDLVWALNEIERLHAEWLNMTQEAIRGAVETEAPRERPSYWTTPDMSDAEAAAVAKRVSSEEWIRFADHFFQSCCDCGLSHRVDVRQASVGEREVRFVRLPEYTEEIRKRLAVEPSAPHDAVLRHSAQTMCEKCGVSVSAHRVDALDGLHFGIETPPPCPCKDCVAARARAAETPKQGNAG